MIIIFKLYTKQMNIFAVFLIIPEVKEPFLFLYLPIIIMQQNIMNEPSWEPEQDKDLNNEFMHSKPPQTHIQFQQIDNSLIKPQPSPIPPSDKFRKKKAQSKKHQRGVQDNPEYFRIDLEVAHKIYEIYRKLKILPPQQYNTLSFEEKEQGHNTINYHKIMQLFKDIDFRLQINHKLQILRAIKKFCFNQNFINEDEFIKIFKVIVHGLGIKQTIFKGIITAKYASVLQRQSKSNHKKAISIKLNKNFGKKLKTQSQMQSSKVRSPFTQMIHQQKSYQTILNPLNADMSYLKKIPTIPPSIVIQESMVKSSRKHESRQRILTQASRYEPNQKLGYLNRAIQKSKLGKLTWQNLFNMTEQNMHHNISIPSFVSQDININDLDI